VNYYSQNRAILEQRFPGIEKKLDRSPEKETQTVQTSDGMVSMKYGGTWIHSSRAPRLEAQRLVETSIPGKCPFCLIYGFGLAYHLEEFQKNHPATPYAVVEPDTALFNYALGLRDYSGIFLDPRFSLALGASPEAMPALLENQPHRNIQVFMLRSVVSLNREYFAGCDRVVQEFLARKEINVNTLNKFSRLWVSNICRNLPLTARYPGVSTLNNSFTGFPALLLAAGPTLEEVLPLLKDLRRRMVVVCVDTALKACLSVGVEPDFLILTDPQYWNSRHLDRCRTSRSILISDVSTYPSVLSDFKGAAFFCSTPFPLGQYFESRSGIKGKLKSGGSVATAAWDFIRCCGMTEIYCAGLDLSFPDGETHYRGSTFEERVHGNSLRLSPVETPSWLSLMGGNPYKAENEMGDDVLTDQRMKIYIRWFEEQMKTFPHIRTSRLSRRGVAIQGMDCSDPDTLQAFPEIREKIDAKLDELKKIPSGTSPESLNLALSSLLEELDDLIRLTGEGMNISAKLKSGSSGPDLLNRLNSIDRAILNRESREMAGFILAPVLEDQFHDSGEVLSESEIIENSLRLYTKLNQSLSFHRSMISRIRI